jgi:hypothetical protein
MNDVGKEYGAALFMLATEEGQREEYGVALNSIKESFVNCPEYVELLSSPNISLNERLSTLNNVFAEAVPEYVLSFLQLMCEKGRIAYYIIVGIASAGSVISSNLLTTGVPENINLNAILAAVCVGGIGLYALSWYLSIIFYKNREL